MVNSVKPQRKQTNSFGNTKTAGLFRASRPGQWMLISEPSSVWFSDPHFLQLIPAFLSPLEARSFLPLAHNYNRVESRSGEQYVNSARPRSGTFDSGRGSHGACKFVGGTTVERPPGEGAFGGDAPHDSNRSLGRFRTFQGHSGNPASSDDFGEAGASVFAALGLRWT
jgi:hypothetical protein